MNNLLRFLPILLLILATGCGGGSSSSGSTCEMTVTGAATTSTACTASGSWDSSNNTGSVGIGVSPPPSGFGTLGMAVTFPGQLAVGTQTSTDAGAVGGGSVVTAANQAWVVSTQPPPQGSYTFSLTSVTGTTTGSGKIYVIHGTMDGTLPAESATGASGTATIHVAF